MKRFIPILLVFSMVMSLTLAAPMHVQAARNISEYYRDQSGWESVVVEWETEDFEGATLNPGLSVTATWLNARVVDGKWYDRLVAPGQYDSSTGQWGPTTTTWTFAEPIYAFGGTWNLGGPGGPGTSIEVFIKDSWTHVGVVPRDYENEFWGFVSDVPFTQVRLEPWTTLGWCETYTLDDLVYSSRPPTLGMKIASWELTNLSGGLTLSKINAIIGDVSGYVIDSRFDIFIPDDDSVKTVSVKHKIGGKLVVEGVPKVGPGHYSLRIRSYIFSWDKYGARLAQTFTLYCTALGIPSFHVSKYDPPPEARILEIIVGTVTSVHIITTSESGQTLPMQIPIYGQDGAVYRWPGEKGTFIIGQCPIDVLVTDNQGRSVGALYDEGVFTGEVNEIEGALYAGAQEEIQFVYLPEPEETCNVEVIGTDTGNYSLDVLTFPGESTASLSMSILTSTGEPNNSFSAFNIPINPGSVHRYEIDWNALSLGENGVTVMVDADGYGTFERSFTTGTELTGDEFVLKTETTVTIDPQTLNLQAPGEWITAYIELPEDYDAEDIDINAVRLLYSGDELYADWGDLQNGVFMAKFDWATVAGWFEGLHDVEVELTVAGEVDGVEFEGPATIRVIDPPHRRGGR